MQTIKVFELLVKAFVGEEMPKRIKYDHHNYIYDELYDSYYQVMTGGNKLYFAFEDLNDNVEIYDEPKKIELDHFKSIEELKEQVDSWIENDELEWTRWFGLYDLKKLIDKINGEENDKN